MAISTNSFSLILFSAACGYEIWHPVDVPMIVCTANGAPGYAAVEIDLANIAAPSAVKPHIVTFYRTSNKSAAVIFEAVDSSSPDPKEVIASTTVDLQSHAARRLAADGKIRESQEVGSSASATAPDERLEDFLELEDDLLEDLLESEEDGTWDAEGDEEDPDYAGRLLRKSAGRSGGGWSRRSPSPRPAPKPAPRPAPKPKPSIAARRRGVPASTAPRRRQTSPVDGTRHSNPSNPQAGAYAYGSPATFNRNYPSGHSTPGYGYSGAQAYKSNSNRNIMMAGAAGVAGGMVMGAGMYYMYSRWNSHSYRYHDYNCQRDGWQGSCRECYQTYSSCQRTLPENAARDDLMNSGFIPADFTSPIIINFTDIAGDDFKADRICPPKGWNPDPANSTVKWEPPMQQDLFLTLTEMTELEEQEDLGASVSASVSLQARLHHSLVFSAGLASLAVFQGSFLALPC